MSFENIGKINSMMRGNDDPMPQIGGGEAVLGAIGAEAKSMELGFNFMQNLDPEAISEILENSSMIKAFTFGFVTFNKGHKHIMSMIKFLAITNAINLGSLSILSSINTLKPTLGFGPGKGG